jgi:CubicO group peptidase (beta-lactamase class C family)
VVCTTAPASSPIRRSRFTKRAAGTRALGWDTCGGSGSCGKYLPADAYGHTGFTGTSLWIDPDRDMFVVLLTNRVHDARAKRPAKVIADVRADLADAAALAVTDYADGMMVMPAHSAPTRRSTGTGRCAGRASIRAEESSELPRTAARTRRRNQRRAAAPRRGEDEQLEDQRIEERSREETGEQTLALVNGSQTAKPEDAGTVAVSCS